MLLSVLLLRMLYFEYLILHHEAMVLSSTFHAQHAWEFMSPLSAPHTGLFDPHSRWLQ
jgi:hypothetical protein